MLNYKIADVISHYTKYGQDFLDNEAFSYLPDIRKLEIDDIDEKKFYKLIGLTPDEIGLFDKNVSVSSDDNKTNDKIINHAKNNKTQKPIVIINNDYNTITKTK